MMARKLVVRLGWLLRKGPKNQQEVDFASNWSIEKLRQEWAAFTKRVIEVITEEEIKLSREEFDQQIGNRTP